VSGEEECTGRSDNELDLLHLLSNRSLRGVDDEWGAPEWREMLGKTKKMEAEREVCTNNWGTWARSTALHTISFREWPYLDPMDIFSPPHFRPK